MKPVFFRTQAALHKWLKANHRSCDALWVGYYKVSSGKESITRSQSVDEALCFGWIDGIGKSIDEQAYMVRFTPRRATSIWSQKNLRRFAELQQQGLIMPAGQEAFDKKKEKYTKRYSFEQGAISLLPEYDAKLRANPDAWKFYEALPPSAKKPTIWWVMSAKRKETQLRRLAILVSSSGAQLRIPLLRVSRKTFK